MIRKVRFPLKIKLTALILVLLLASTCLYLFFAIRLFKADKSAYIFEDALKANESLQTGLKLEVKRAYDLLRLLGQTTTSSNVLASIHQILEYSQFERSAQSLSRTGQYLNYALAEEYGQLPQSLNELDKRHPYDTLRLFYHPEEIFAVFADDEIPHLILSYKNGQDRLSVLRILANDFIKALNRDQKYHSYLIRSDGSPFANITDQQLSERKLAIEKVLAGQSAGVIEAALINRDQKRMLMAYSPLAELKLMLISEIPEETAFRAGQYLINKSLYFGILLMAISIIVGILFARRLTNNLSRLAKAADFVASRDFDKSVEINTSDEIGALSDTFNSMFKQIRRYMDEMKEKARLENELEVAKLVQESFIPKSHVKSDNIELATYYHSASECGGDWWSYLEFPERLIFFIADATGHGVPAAFLTATANCCAANIQYHASIDPELTSSPGKILSLMNHAISSMGTKIHMTAFVAVLEKSCGKLTYANASHPHPYFLANKMRSNERPSKQDIQVLLGESGPRLGHQLNQIYPEHQVQLEEGDTLVFYTDGTLENCSPDNTPYGNRRFINSLLSNLSLPLGDFRSGLVSDLLQHLDEASLEDDITLALCRFHRPHNSPHYPSEDVQQNDKYQVVESSKLAEYSQTENPSWENLFVLAKEQDEYNITQLLEQYPIHHLVGSNSKDISGEIEQAQLPSAEQLQIRVGDNFKIRTKSLTSSAEISSTINELFSEYELFNTVDNIIQYLKTMANELLTNAFHNAGKESPSDRQSIVNLHGKEVTIELSWGDKATMLMVRDQFGNLKYSDLRQGLLRGYKEKSPLHGSGGAGLGLYLCFNFSNQLIINVTPNIQTEVLCIIENTRRYRDYKARITSFHYNQYSC